MWIMGRKRKISKAMEAVRAEFANSVPAIDDHLFYGSVETDPKSLAMWYLFQTETELEQARASGLCTRIQAATIRNLRRLHYPAAACAGLMVSFTSWEHIQQDADGNEYVYFH